METLPAEILEKILMYVIRKRPSPWIGFEWGMNSPLDCRLVSMKWNELLTPHLTDGIHRVNITDGNQLPKLVSIVRSRVQGGIPFRDFKIYLTSPCSFSHSNLAEFCELFGPGIMSLSLNFCFEMGPHTRELHQKIVYILSKCPNVMELHFSSRKPPGRPGLLEMLTALSVGTINFFARREVTGNDGLDFIPKIGHFPHLKKLSVTGICALPSYFQITLEEITKNSPRLAEGEFHFHFNRSLATTGTDRALLKFPGVPLNLKLKLNIFFGFCDVENIRIVEKFADLPFTISHLTLEIPIESPGLMAELARWVTSLAQTEKLKHFCIISTSIQLPTFPFLADFAEIGERNSEINGFSPGQFPKLKTLEVSIGVLLKLSGQVFPLVHVLRIRYEPKAQNGNLILPPIRLTFPRLSVLLLANFQPCTLAAWIPNLGGVKELYLSLEEGIFQSSVNGKEYWNAFTGHAKPVTWEKLLEGTLDNNEGKTEKPSKPLNELGGLEMFSIVFDTDAWKSNQTPSRDYHFDGIINQIVKSILWMSRQGQLNQLESICIYRDGNFSKMDRQMLSRIYKVFRHKHERVALRL